MNLYLKNPLIRFFLLFQTLGLTGSRVLHFLFQDAADKSVLINELLMNWSFLSQWMLLFLFSLFVHNKTKILIEHQVKPDPARLSIVLHCFKTSPSRLGRISLAYSFCSYLTHLYFMQRGVSAFAASDGLLLAVFYLAGGMCSLILVLSSSHTHLMAQTKSYFPESRVHSRSNSEYYPAIRMRLILYPLVLAGLPSLLFLSSIYHGFTQSQSLMIQGNPLQVEMLFLFGLYFLLAVFIMRDLQIAILSPVDGLVRKMNQVKEGDFNVRTTVFGFDEISSLKSSFNTMVHSLQGSQEVQGKIEASLGSELTKEILEEGFEDQSVTASVVSIVLWGFPGNSISLLRDLVERFCKFKEEGGVHPIEISQNRISFVFGAIEPDVHHAQQALEFARFCLKESLKVNILRNRKGELPVQCQFYCHTASCEVAWVKARSASRFVVTGKLVEDLAASPKESHSGIFLSESFSNSLSEEAKLAQNTGMIQLKKLEFKKLELESD